jgi:hypothetical protein
MPIVLSPESATRRCASNWSAHTPSSPPVWSTFTQLALLLLLPSLLAAAASAARAVSHTRMVLSSDPEMARWADGRKETLPTGPVWPLSVQLRVAVVALMSHSLTVMSWLDEISRSFSLSN